MGFDCISVEMTGRNGSDYTLTEDNITVPGTLLTSGTWSLEYILLAVYLTVCSFVGILGNVPVLIVYFHKRDHAVSNTFIKVLAILDLLVCTLIMPYTMIYELHMVSSDVACRLFEFLRHFVISASNITLVAISVERYIAVCHLARKMSVDLVNKGIICIGVISCVMAAPAVGTFAVVSYKDIQDIHCSYDKFHVSTGHFCHFTYSEMGELSVSIYQGFLAVSFIVTFGTIMVLYIIVYYVLWKRSKLRRRRHARSQIVSDICEISCSREKVTTEKTQYLEMEHSKSLIEPTEANSVSEKDSDLYIQERSVQEYVPPPDKPRHRMKHTTSVLLERENLRRAAHRKTAKMLFLCSVIYLVTWMPFWMDIFGITGNLLLRYAFFIGNASNPIVYGIVNTQIRKSFRKMLIDFVQKIFPCFLSE
ncbi:neuropeptide Y receptor type 6-like [Saccostrea cucullata]|uniref:neuropeptide Y receptor type 6-like n=1 Tax=Saccostrea cuccullata TaxID=36930 RepID=UPI002ED2DEED